MSEPVYFLRLEVENYRCFKKNVVLDLSDGKGNWKKWTVILGNNGTGKSSLLELLAKSERKEIESLKKSPLSPRQIVDEILRNFNRPRPQFDDFKIGDIKINLNISWEAKGLLTNQLDGIVVENIPIFPSSYENTRLKELQCFGYGANRRMGESSFAKLSDYNSETLFDDSARLINAEEWLLQLDYAASKESSIKRYAIKKRDQIKQILLDLLPDIEDIRFTEPTLKDLISTVEFKTPYGWVTIHQLSLGYKTMVSWMVDLAARMFERYPDSDNPLAEPAIVLVDEIDLHMHPKWQRNIFDYLSEKFPQTQFIVTAHSPLVVQSAPKDANIVLLRKEGDHVVIDNDIKSVQNWRIDQILTSDLFGIDSARGPETAEWLKERKELLQKQSLTNQEKERLNELNQRSFNLPTEEKKEDIEAMELIRKAAEHLKNHKA